MCDTAYSSQDVYKRQLIGANGAGKSTTLNTIAGLLKPRSGHVTFDGKNIAGMQASKVVSLGMALCPEGRRVFQQMSVREKDVYKRQPLRCRKVQMKPAMKKSPG